MEDIINRKKEFRKHFNEVRKSIDECDRKLADRILFEKTISSDVYKNAKTVLVYFSIKNEPNVLLIAEHALKSNKRIAFPISETRDLTLVFKYVNSFDELVEGAYSIPEPPMCAEGYVNTSETLCIVPGLVFDRLGMRLGYGKGYYDRFLSSFKGTTLGLCYADMLVDELPVEKTDVPIDIIFSDKEEIFINGI